ncbi:AIR synthase family protein [Halorussus sp. MSC15.2]|uniref:AIR synthase family protein n=1 Tax=Halorussus sp. MSC15.2 TaxID=2283638 RepID=UPI0013D75863|nr:AIR synthase family protein [Halorussus sp. MSC15.2]NEU58687.1 hydrogenase expression protein [Halorussus sp. MSC15.2]
MSGENGKIDAEFFEEHISPNLGATRDAVAVGPRHGIDFGVLAVGDQRLIVATDPVSVMPKIGFARAGKLALHSVLSDVAVSGIPPSFLSVNFTLPSEMTDAEFAELWEAMTAECERLGVSVVTGHTSRQDVSFPWVGGATAMGVGSPERIVRPDGAQPGDTVLLTNGPGIEVAGLFAALAGDQLDVGAGLVERAEARLDETTLVRDALTAVDAGTVTAMHDATECGLQGALVELADVNDLNFAVSSDRLPEQRDVTGICESVNLDPWKVSSRGTLLITTPKQYVDSIVSALEDRGTPATIIGEVREGTGVTVDGNQVTHPDTDPAWEAFESFQ